MVEHTPNAGKTNWDGVTRTVLATKPKVEDVPDMIDWYKFHGGGTKRVFVRSIIAMCDKHVPASRLVSGTFFRSLAKLKFAADAKPPTLFIHAMLIVHAAAKEHVVDNIAKFLKSTEAESISVGSKRCVAAAKANEVIIKANALGNSTGLPDYMLIDAKFNLYDRLVRLVFKYDPNKAAKEVDSKFVTMESISEAYVEDVMSLSPHVAAKTSAALRAEPTESSAEGSNLAEFNEAGEAIAQGRMTIINKGFRIGQKVITAKGKIDDLWEIVSIGENGDVSMSHVDANGDPIQTSKVVTPIS